MFWKLAADRNQRVLVGMMDLSSAMILPTHQIIRFRDIDFVKVLLVPDVLGLFFTIFLVFLPFL
jgi:hypothetical protein